MIATQIYNLTKYKEALLHKKEVDFISPLQKDEGYYYIAFRIKNIPLEFQLAYIYLTDEYVLICNDQASIIEGEKHFLETLNQYIYETPK